MNSRDTRVSHVSLKNAGTVLIALCAALAVGACSKQPSTASNQQGTQSPETAAPAAAAPTDTGPAAADAVAPGTAAETAAAAPVETVSETEDGAATTPDTPATVQPSLRLGGAPTTSPTSAQFKEGVNYTKLVPAQPTSVAPGKVEVVEVFWYGCGHCFALDPAIESWRAKGKPANVEFMRVPAMWNEATRMHARVFFTAELLGKGEALHAPLFREINVKGNPLNTVDRIAAFFRDNGVSNDDFQKAFSSFAVENKLQRADFLNRRYRIESVPAVIVNGKYKTAVSDAGGEPQLFTLINELAAHESGS
jgi:thiol:disulfide interchange protein DsbA